MPLIDKSSMMAETIALIPNGASIFVGGFGVPGTPFCLIEELVNQAQSDLTIIKNDANEKGMGVDLLLKNNQVSKLITSHIGLNSNAIVLMNDKQIEVEFVSQGTLAERIRVAGAGLLGFVTDIGIDTSLTEGKERITINGAIGVVEQALYADFALLHASCADSFGNLTYTATAQNFNPIMAMAARVTIVETEQAVGLGQIRPENIHTPGPFVDHVIPLTTLSDVYDVVKR